MKIDSMTRTILNREFLCDATIFEAQAIPSIKDCIYRISMMLGALIEICEDGKRLTGHAMTQYHRLCRATVSYIIGLICTNWSTINKITYPPNEWGHELYLIRGTEFKQYCVESQIYTYSEFANHLQMMWHYLHKSDYSIMRNVIESRNILRSLLQHINNEQFIRSVDELRKKESINGRKN